MIRIRNPFHKPNRYYDFLIKLKEAGLGVRVDMTNFLESMYPFDEYSPDSIFSQNEAVLLFLNEMVLNKHIRYDTIILNNDELKMDSNTYPHLGYSVRITVEGLDFVDKIISSERWMLTTTISAVPVIIALLVIFKQGFDKLTDQSAVLQKHHVEQTEKKQPVPLPPSTKPTATSKPETIKKH